MGRLELGSAALGYVAKGGLGRHRELKASESISIYSFGIFIAGSCSRREHKKGKYASSEIIASLNTYNPLFVLSPLESFASTFGTECFGA